MTERNSRISAFYKNSRQERLQTLIDRGFLNNEGADLLASTGSVLDFERADNMIENVVGVFELPIGMGLNLRVNERDYVVPMVVEEPSIVAAVSHAAAVARTAGGFTAHADPSVMIGQIQVVGLDDLDVAAAQVEAAHDELVALANDIEPGMKSRGGGAIELDVRTFDSGDGRYHRMLVVHLYIDTCDAMGANLINTMAEGIAGRIEELTGGSVFLRILSNLADRRRVKARCQIPVGNLAWQEFTGEQVADGIVAASAFAEADPYRAATHNKGIMNGIDAAAIAVGQDWRAIEAGAHAFAALGGQYSPMATWHRDPASGDLIGVLDIPMQVGTVGGPIRFHPTVKTLLEILDVDSSTELACVLGAVGLAQNFSAIKALGTTGIQKGHMALHARTVAATAGATGTDVDRIARAMIADGEIKVHRARTLLDDADADS